MSYRIEWDGVPRPDLEAALREELDWIMDGQPQGLVFHTMMVAGADVGSAGPSVGAHWDEERQCVLATYSAETKWERLKDGLHNAGDASPSENGAE